MSHHSARLEKERADYGGAMHDGSNGTTVFISNINYSTTKQQIKEHLRKAEGIVRIEIFKDGFGNSKGYGLIEFEDAESAEAVIHRYNDSVLNERNMKMRKSKGSDERRKDSPVDQGTRRKVPLRDPSTTIFIHNLDYNVTWQKLKDVFKVVGHVVNAEMLENRKGAGIVQFTSQQDALNAIAMFHGQMLMDRPMQVRMDSRAPYQPDPLELRLSHIQGRTSSRRMSPSPRREHRDERAHVRKSRHDYHSRAQEVGHRARSRSPVYTRAMSYSPSPSPPPPPRYGGGYRNKEPYYSPLSSDREEPHYSSRPSKAYHADHEYSHRERRHKRELHARPSYSPSPPPSHDYHGQENITSVFIKNLPYQTTWQKLKDVFRKAGQVRRADIKLRDGKPSGLALVFFTTHKDAVRAIDLFNDTIYEGRRIIVQLNLEQEKQREQHFQWRDRH